MEVRYVKTDEFNFFITSNNYLYETNYNSNKSKFYDVTVDLLKIDELVVKKFPNDRSEVGETEIVAVVYKFDDVMYGSEFQSNRTGTVADPLIYEDISIMKNNKRGRKIAELKNSI